MGKHQNIFIIGFAFLAMIGAIFFKQYKVSSSTSNAGVQSQKIQELKQTISLKEQWGDKKISKKINTLQTIVPKEKIEWKKKKKEMSALYTGLSPNELNNLITKILNIPLQIVRLDIKKNNDSYALELICKW